MKTIYIKSTFSEIDELDGLYKVTIPKEYENNYQDIIENVSSMLDIIQANNYPSNLEELKKELEETEYNEISKEFLLIKQLVFMETVLFNAIKLSTLMKILSIQHLKQIVDFMIIIYQTVI